MKTGVDRNGGWPYQQSVTYTKDALTACYNEVKSGSGARSGATKVVMILTDGTPSQGQDPTGISNTIKANGVQLYYVAIGSGLSTAVRNQMKTWASPNGYFPLTSFNVGSLVAPLKKQACSTATTGTLNGQCKGPFEWKGMIGGGWHRGATYSTAVPAAGNLYRYMGMQSNNWGLGAGTTNSWCTCSNDWSQVTAVSARRRRDRAESSSRNICDSSAGPYNGASYCNVKCPAAQSEICGGVYFNSVYDLAPRDCVISSWSSYSTCSPACTPQSQLTAAGSWHFCSSEGSACSFSGTYEVRFGYSGGWITKNFDNGVQCSKAAFNVANETVSTTPGWKSARSKSGGLSCYYRATNPAPSGKKQRTRTILTQPANGGKACGSVTDSTSCGGGVCAQNCVLASWSSWSTCNKACGGGTQTATRAIITPSAGTGKPCPVGADLTSTQACNTQACAVNCALGEWTSYGKCTTDGSLSATELPVYTGPLPPNTVSSVTTCKDAKVDMCIAVDMSGSVEYQAGGTYYGCKNNNHGTYAQAVANCPNWGQEVKFVYDLMNAFKEDLGPDGVQIGALAFDTSIVTKFALNKYTNPEDIKTGVTWKYDGGGTFTSGAISSCNTMLTTGAGARTGNDVSKVILIVTDGTPNSQHQTTAHANSVKAAGVNLYFVGIGTQLSSDARSHMQGWSTKDSYFGLSSFSLNSLVAPLMSQTCSTAQVTRYCHAEPSGASATTATAACYKGSGGGYKSFSSGTCASNGCQTAFASNDKKIGSANQGWYLCGSWAASIAQVSMPTLSGAVQMSSKASPQGCYAEGNTPYYNDGSQTATDASGNQEVICYCIPCSRRSLPRPVSERRAVSTSITAAGLKMRTRAITTQPNSAGKQCDITNEKTTCGTLVCNTDCSLTQWGSWGTCSKTCGTGERFVPVRSSSGAQALAPPAVASLMSSLATPSLVLWTAS